MVGVGRENGRTLSKLRLTTGKSSCLATAWQRDVFDILQSNNIGHKSSLRVLAKNGFPQVCHLCFTGHHPFIAIQSKP